MTTPFVMTDPGLKLQVFRRRDARSHLQTSGRYHLKGCP